METEGSKYHEDRERREEQRERVREAPLAAKETVIRREGQTLRLSTIILSSTTILDCCAVLRDRR